MLYGLNAINICNNQVNELQTFSSGSKRYLIYGRYGEQEDRKIKNTHIKEKYNIPTIESKLEYYTYKTSLNWEPNLYWNYLNHIAISDNFFGEY